MSPLREPWLKEYRMDGEGAAAVGVAAAQSPGLPGPCVPGGEAIPSGEGHVAGWGGACTPRGKSSQFPRARF